MTLKRERAQSVINENGEYYCVYHGRDITPDFCIKVDTGTARICRLKLDGASFTATLYENKT